jgi:hypothetical protein
LSNAGVFGAVTIFFSNWFDIFFFTAVMQ